MNEEIILSGKHKDWEVDEHYSLNNASKEEVLHILANLSEKIDSDSYRYSGIDVEKVDKVALDMHCMSSSGFGISGLATPLKGKKSSELRKELLEACNGEKKLMVVAESYLMHSLLKKLQVPFKLDPKNFKSNIKPTKENIQGRIVFVGNYKGWMVIKKLKLEKAKDYEVSAILGSINYTIVNKMFELAEVEDEETVTKLTKGKRKGLVALAEALGEIEEKDKNKLAYLVCKVCEKLGYRPYATPHMLVKAYPDIKPPKSRGRKKK